MPDQSGPGPSEELRNEHAKTEGPDRQSETAVEPQKAWGRIERKRLLIWAGIAFGVPGVLMLAVHRAGGGASSAFSVRSELPVKAVMVLFVFLATWIVARIEKRSIDEYGIPLNQAFGWRFWRGRSGALRCCRRFC